MPERPRLSVFDEEGGKLERLLLFARAQSLAQQECQLLGFAKRCLMDGVMSVALVETRTRHIAPAPLFDLIGGRHILTR